LIFGATRAEKSAVATSQRQKCDDDHQEKFDCDEDARRFDLIRSSRPMLLLLALSYAFEIRSPARGIAPARATTVLGDAYNIWANQESSEHAPAAAQSFACGRVRRCNGVNGARDRSRQRMIRAASARDNSIVTALGGCRARVQRLREIKTNVLSLAHLHGAKIALRADD
jgi:hypothetical protein